MLSQTGCQELGSGPQSCEQRVVAAAFPDEQEQQGVESYLKLGAVGTAEGYVFNKSRATELPVQLLRLCLHPRMHRCGGTSLERASPFAHPRATVQSHR